MVLLKRKLSTLIYVSLSCSSICTMSMAVAPLLVTGFKKKKKERKRKERKFSNKNF